MSEDDRSWHSQHRQRKAASEDTVSPLVSILMMIVGTIIMTAVSILIVASMMK